MAVQVEPEPPVGMGMRMTACAGIVEGSVPQGEADPLTGIRPGGRSPDHEVHRTGAVTPCDVMPLATPVPGQGDGQPRPQQAVGSDPRHVPAQQVRCQLAEIGPELGRDFATVDACHGARIEIDIDARGGARPRPVADVAAGGRSLDHGRRHGELTHARPEGESGKAGNPVRGLSEHQHSPCVDGSPNRAE